MADDKPSRRPTQEFKVQPAGETTVRPPFDPQEFARDSESRLRIADVISVDVQLDDSEPPPSSESATRLAVAGASRGSAPPPDAVPFRVMAPEDVEWFELDHDALALLDRVNGLKTIARIADTIGVAAPLACAIFMRLASERIVGFR